eukprot:gene29936-39738_t
MTTNFTKEWYPELVANASAVLTYPKIACVPLKYILSAIDVKHIDVWVLDVEGAEEKALMGTDFNMVKIDTILVECDSSDLKKNERVMRNSVCIHDSFRPRISSLATHKEDIYKAFNGTSVVVNKISQKSIFYVDYSTVRDESNNFLFPSYAAYSEYLDNKNGTPAVVMPDKLADLFTIVNGSYTINPITNINSNSNRTASASRRKEKKILPEKSIYILGRKPALRDHQIKPHL